MNTVAFTGKQKINKAIAVFTDAQNMLKEAITTKNKEMGKVTEKIQKLNVKMSDHEDDLKKAETVLGNLNKILGTTEDEVESK